MDSLWNVICSNVWYCLEYIYCLQSFPGELFQLTVCKFHQTKESEQVKNLCYEQKMHDLQVSSSEKMESSADQTHSETKQNKC